MNQVLTQLRVQTRENETGQWCSGEIKACSDQGQFRILTNQGQVLDSVGKAFSCLMQPQIGDRVALFMDEHGQSYILSILERPTERNEQPADAQLEFRGQLTLNAKAGLRLSTLQTMKVEAEQLHGRVTRVEWLSRLARLTSKELMVVTGLARLSARLRELMAGSLHVSADNSVRQIHNTDMLRTRVHDVEADNLVRIKAPCTLVKGETLVKVDSKQVHIG